MKNTFVVLFCLFLVASNAQKENIVLTLHLKNGDVISGKSDLREISFKTDYGNLKLPVSDVNSINIGLQNSEFDKARLLDLLDKLDSGTEKDKEHAFDEIIKMNEGSIPFIKSYIGNSKEKESRNDLSVHVLFEVMLAKYNIKRNYNIYDEIFHNGKSTLEGTWQFEDLLLESAYGRIRINRKSIESVDVKVLTADGFEKNNSFKIFANRYITGNKDGGWLNTGILVKKGEQLQLETVGEVILESISGSKFTADGGINDAPAPVDKNVVYGNLVLKIGEKGKMIKGGEKMNFISNKTGIIYLSIYEIVYNLNNSGYFDVNVKVK